MDREQTVAQGQGDRKQARREAETEVAKLIAAMARELRERVERRTLDSPVASGIQALAQLVAAFYGEDGVAGTGEDDEDEDEEGDEDDDEDDDEEGEDEEGEEEGEEEE